MARSATAVVLFGVLGCADEGLPLPAIEWEGEHVRFGTSADIGALCAGSLPFADAYVGGLKRAFDTPDDWIVDAYWVPDGATRYEACSNADGIGCSTRGGDALYPEFPSEHELVHATRAGTGWAHRVLEEGAAVHWDADDVFLPKQEDIAAAISATEGGRALPAKYYATAGHFVAALAEQTDHDELIALLHESGPIGASRAALEDTFEDVLALPLEDVIDEYERSYAWCPPFEAHDASVVCETAEPMTCLPDDALGMKLEARADLTCSTDGVIGPYQEEVWRNFVFTIPYAAAGDYFLNVRPITERTTMPFENFADWGYVLVETCGSGCGRTVIRVNPDYPMLHRYTLESGTYRVRIARRLDALDDSVTGFRFFLTGDDPLEPSAPCGY